MAAAANDDYPVRRWRVTSPTGVVMEVLFTPAAARAEVAAIYPGATLKVLPEPAGQATTPAEAAELRGLVALVATEWPEDQRAEALAAALAHPEATLMSFRLLAAESRSRKPDHDD